MKNSLILFILLGSLLWGQEELNSPAAYGKQNIWDSQGLSIAYHGPRDQKWIALTIDDGWTPDYELLAYLQEEGIRCTVFIPGKLVKARPEWVKTMDEMGFEICSHGYSHKLLPFLPVEEQIQELIESSAIIEEITGKTVPYMRPSGGRLDGPQPSLEVIREQGYTVILWENDVKGYSSRDSIESQLSWLWDNLQPGNIVLSHFGESLNTLDVLKIWIPQVRSLGYEFVTVSELMTRDKE